MARFSHIDNIYVNAEQVLYIEPAGDKYEASILHFSGGQTLRLNRPTNEVIVFFGASGYGSPAS